MLANSYAVATTPASSAAPITSSSVGARTVDAGRPASGDAACLSWPVWLSIAMPTMLAHTRVAKDRAMGKEDSCEVLFA